MTLASATAPLHVHGRQAATGGRTPTKAGGNWPLATGHRRDSAVPIASGFPAKPFTGHLGLRSIQERAARLGGTCSIESAPKQGTYLRVRIPAREEPGSAVEASER